MMDQLRYVELINLIQSGVKGSDVFHYLFWYRWLMEKDYNGAIFCNYLRLIFVALEMNMSNHDLGNKTPIDLHGTELYDGRLIDQPMIEGQEHCLGYLLVLKVLVCWHLAN